MKPAVFHLGKGIEVERETCTALPPVVATEGGGRIQPRTVTTDVDGRSRIVF